MSGLVLGLGDVPLNLPQLPASSHAQKASKHKEAEHTKKAYNCHVQELKQLFNTEVDKIALEFSRQNLHHSCQQIRKQVLFSMNQLEKKNVNHQSIMHGCMQKCKYNNLEVRQC